jgi:hypothetical protein
MPSLSFPERFHPADILLLLGHRMGEGELIPTSAPSPNIQTVSRLKFSSWSAKRLKAFSVVYRARRVHAVAQLVEVQRYKPEGRGFDSSLLRGSELNGCVVNTSSDATCTLAD